MRTMILALVLLCVACGGEGLAPDSDTVSGPSLVGHPLLGRWRSPGGHGAHDLVFQENGTYVLHIDGTFGPTCRSVSDTTFAIIVEGRTEGTIARLGPTYGHQVITCANPDESRVNEGPGSTRQRSPERFSISGETLTLGTGAYQRVP